MIARNPAAVKRGRNGELAFAHSLVDMGVPVFTARLDQAGAPHRTEWEKITPSHREVERWKPGLGLCAHTGVAFDVLDIDPGKGGKDSYGKLCSLLGRKPEVYVKVVTRSGGWHLYVAPLGLGTHHPIPGFPGLDLQGKGAMVFIPPTVRLGGTYLLKVEYLDSLVDPEVDTALADLVRTAIAGTGQDGGEGGGGRHSTDELWAAVLAAPEGAQRTALLRWVDELEKRYKREDVVAFLSAMRPHIPVYDKRRPWRESDLLGMLHAPGVRIPDALPSELAGLGKEDDEEFWDSRPVLAHIRAWAMARRASPWAVLGEALAEAICHTPPSFQLPPLVGGNGTLNMLIAMVGKSGAGKLSAHAAALSAIKWHGIVGCIPDRIERLPLGSGEGLARNYGFTRKNETGHELSRLRYSAITTIAEIDTFAAIGGRSGSTISPELRKFYSGESLGFSYADPNKRVIIPEHSYRGCVIAGVQPGRGEVILGDMDGGFPQRWLWLPATDPSAPDLRPKAPLALEWEPPGNISLLEPESGPLIMKVCAQAREDIDEARLNSLRGTGADQDSHSLYTRLKIAAGLALLDERDAVTDADWELSGVVMKVSDRTRDGVAAHLRRKSAEENVARGRAEGIRREVADATVQKRANARVAQNVLNKLSREWTSRTTLRNSIARRDRESLDEVLSGLVESGRVESQSYEYRGQPGIQYRRAPK